MAEGHMNSIRAPLTQKRQHSGVPEWTRAGFIEIFGGCPAVVSGTDTLP